MGNRVLLAALVASLAGCDTPTGPRAELGSTLDPDGNHANLQMGVVASANGSSISQREKGVRQLTFSAAKHADGRITGQYNFTTEGNFRQLRGSIVCMRVEGNRAFLVGDVKHDRLSDFPLPVGGIAIEAVDGGQTGDAISQIGLAPSTESLMEWCTSGAAGPVDSVDNGQVQIRAE
jgi:hypothetical protein